MAAVSGILPPAALARPCAAAHTARSGCPARASTPPPPGPEAARLPSRRLEIAQGNSEIKASRETAVSPPCGAFDLAAIAKRNSCARVDCEHQGVGLMCAVAQRSRRSVVKTENPAEPPPVRAGSVI